MIMDKALQLFLIDEKLRGNTEETILNYRRIVGYFLDYVGREIDVSDIDLKTVREYQLNLSDREADIHFNKEIHRKLAKKTIQTYIRQLRVFINWLYAEGYIENDIGSKVKLPKAPKVAIEVLSEEEIKMLYGAMNDRTEFGLRNKCIISLMLDSGLRREEVIELEIENIHFTQNVVKVKGKGEKERIVPIGLYTKKLLYKYLNGFRPYPEFETNRVFLSQDKVPVTSDVVKMVFLRLRKRTGIKRLKPHLLRHTFATRYLINGGDAFSLQMILGHTSLDMTRKYSHLASSYTLKNFNMMSTLDRLRGQNVRL